MRRHELTHPHIAIITIDPVQFADLRRLLQDSLEVIVADVDRSQPDRWTVTARCASEAVRERFEDGWS
ncbi:MAG: hypothetical protein ACK5YI_00605 [Rhodospirillales bacterium]